jgi:hypothetical protein
MVSVRLALASSVLFAVAGCDGGSSAPLDAGPTLEGASVDAALGPTDAGATPDAAPRADAGPQPAFDVPRDRAWHYQEVPGAVCANGTPLGIALNLDPSSDRLVLYLQGGGGCWSATTCVLLQTAAHIGDTLDEATVLGEAETAGGFVLDRDDPDNPFRDQSFVYVPYCTGDVHVGDASTTYRTPRTTRTIEHRGAANIERILARLAATFPALHRLTMIGISAGGYGVAVNAFRGRMAFPDARVDVLDDSGLPIDANPDQWAEMLESWRPPLPDDCPDCMRGFTALIPYYGRTMPAGSRFGVLGFRMDGTIRTYFGGSADQIATAFDASVEAMGTFPDQRSFVVNGDDHVLLTRPGLATTTGVTVRDWVRSFATDDPDWATVGP